MVLAILVDVAAWLVAYVVFIGLRLADIDMDVPWLEVFGVALGAAVLHVALGLGVFLYQGRTATGTFGQLTLLAGVTFTAGGLISCLNMVMMWVPRSVPVAATCATLVLIATARGAWRYLRDHLAVGRPGKGTAERVLVVGAGEAARELLGSMLRDPELRWAPVGLLDDDPAKRHRRIRNVRVVGTTRDIAQAMTETGATAVIIAVPSAGPTVVARINKDAVAAGADVLVVPSFSELLSGHVGIRDLRDINLHDVLGRKVLDTDVDKIAHYLTGKRVLVTGAGGSIGAELCRQIHRYGPAQLMMLDRDESALHAVQLSIHGRALLDSDDVVLCDIRDADALNQIFTHRRPEVVFHAAALKHLPMLEQYPAEAVKTNVVGTLNVLQAAEAVGAEKFVNISTDKAANPVSILGHSKRVAERLTAARAETCEGTYLSVRFGNVLGSRGSVLTAFAKQIADGGPVTVTHPEVTRFFMTIEEACQLVIQAAAIGVGGEALVLDMGDPVKIVEMAKSLIERSGQPIEIEITGLRDGEKLHEELFADHEPRNIRPRHPLVSHVPVQPLWSVDLAELIVASTPHDVVREFEELWSADLAAADSADRGGR
ncbi:nucleoside-diphosphate sugar epimerase/dehydratase [Nocardioides dubius]